MDRIKYQFNQFPTKGQYCRQLNTYVNFCQDTACRYSFQCKVFFDHGSGIKTPGWQRPKPFI